MLRIFTPKNKKEEQEVLDHLSSVAKQVYDARLEHVLSVLENDVQKVIFLDWWYGGSLFNGYDKDLNCHRRAKRYEFVSEHDWNEVSDYILETCSLGMG